MKRHLLLLIAVFFLYTKTYVQKQELSMSFSYQKTRMSIVRG